MQRFYYLICENNRCQNVSIFIRQKGKNSFCEILKARSIVSLISMYDAELADDRNHVDVKINPRQACLFLNTRCSILPQCFILPRLPPYLSSIMTYQLMEDKDYINHNFQAINE